MAQARLSDQALRRVLLALWTHRTCTARQLAAASGVPAAQVLAALTALAARGCLIEQTPDGLTLVQTGIACWRDIIEARLWSAVPQLPADRRVLGARALVFQKIASTNDTCWQHASDPAAHGLVVVADEQTAGRGRRGAAWLAKPGQSILLSVLLRDWEAANLDQLTLQLGLAAAQAIEQVAGEETTIKWPNDVLLQGRKVAGVLVETQSGATAERPHVVLGIGLNVTQSAADFPAGLRARATALYQATGRVIDRAVVLAALLRHVEAVCLAALPPDAWLPLWKARCPALGQVLRVQSVDGTVTGQVLDIDPLHGLILLDPSGTRRFLSARTSTLVQ